MDESFQFSFFRSAGLTPAEQQYLEQVHKFYQLAYRPPDGGKIAGALLYPDGRQFWIISGKHGGISGGTVDGFLPRGMGTGVNRFTVTHVEGHSASLMHWTAARTIREAPVAEAALLLPVPPCGACAPNLPAMLPRGTRMFVVDPHSTTVFQSPSGALREGLRFPREDGMFIGGPSFGIRGVGGVANLGLFAIGVFVNGINAEDDNRDFRDQLARLEADVRAELPDLLMEALEIQASGHQPRVNFTAEVVRTTTRGKGTMGPLDERKQYRFKLIRVGVSFETVERGSEPEIDDPLSGFGLSLETTATWQQTRSFDWTLPSELVAVYAEYHDQMQWFDDAASSGLFAGSDWNRLATERFWLDQRFRQRLKWVAPKLTEKPPPPPAHAAPAPIWALPQQPPPPLPPPRWPELPPVPPAPLSTPDGGSDGKERGTVRPGDGGKSASVVTATGGAMGGRARFDIKAAANKVFSAIHPGETVTYRQVIQRTGLLIDDVILAADELNRQGRVVQIGATEPNKKQIWRSK